jgi:hypothetical protein
VYCAELQTDGQGGQASLGLGDVSSVVEGVGGNCFFPHAGKEEGHTIQTHTSSPVFGVLGIVGP